MGLHNIFYYTATKLVFIIFVMGLFNSNVKADEFNYGDLPVLTLNTDFNGVNPTSGSFITVSPILFKATGLANKASDVGISVADKKLKENY